METDFSWLGVWLVLSGNRLIDAIFAYIVSFLVLTPLSAIGIWLSRKKAITKKNIFFMIHITGYFFAYAISLYSIWINTLIPYLNYKFQYIPFLVGFSFLLLINAILINFFDSFKFKKILLISIMVMLTTILIMPDLLRESGVSWAYFDD